MVNTYLYKLISQAGKACCTDCNELSLALETLCDYMPGVNNYLSYNVICRNPTATTAMTPGCTPLPLKEDNPLIVANNLRRKFSKKHSSGKINSTVVHVHYYIKLFSTYVSVW